MHCAATTHVTALTGVSCTLLFQANHSDESSAPDTADGTVACYDRQQWTCSQCGRLYRDSVVFARHLQDHYRPVYLRELAGRQRGGGRGARRGRGRPRGQGWSRPFAPPRRSSSPAGAIEEEDEEAVEIGEGLCGRPCVEAMPPGRHGLRLNPLDVVTSISTQRCLACISTATSAKCSVSQRALR